ncbi:MAG: hypothetical protein AAB654_11165 [Acidobacteriota bacterium]
MSKSGNPFVDELVAEVRGSLATKLHVVEAHTERLTEAVAVFVSGVDRFAASVRQLERLLAGLPPPARGLSEEAPRPGWFARLSGRA